MNRKLLFSIVSGFFLIPLLFNCPVNGQYNDWRNAKNGVPIYTNGYIDQPYVVVLKDRSWLVVFTTGAGKEGTGGQHIVASLSTDQGKKWSDPVRIEEPSDESASWAMPYLTEYGRIYVFYDYNGDKIHSLGARQNIREDMFGWYCFKYSDDNGKSWSKRYRLPVRLTDVDRVNDWKGAVQILWGIGKPINLDKGMMFAFTKIGKYMLEDSEGWFFRCKNINTERDPGKLNWEMLPEGEKGLKNTDLGTINAEQNIVQLSNGTVYCMHRTIAGFPAESYSYDRGESWTLPEIPRYYDGRKIKHPRACPRIWKCKNGKYLFWNHFNGGADFMGRNPAWISGGIEKDGKIIWSQPEILFYEDEVALRMSYPDLIEQDGKYWITETNKENGRCHPVPAAFLDKLWSQIDINKECSEGLIYTNGGKAIAPGMELQVPSFQQDKYVPGFTIDLVFSLTELAAGQEIFNFKDVSGKEIRMTTEDFGAVGLTINNGSNVQKFISDPGLIKAFGDNSVTAILDNESTIVQFVINGIVNDGADFRSYGWSRFEGEISQFGAGKLIIGKLEPGAIRPESAVKLIRIYNHPLLNTEIIGNHRANKSVFTIHDRQVMNN